MTRKRTLFILLFLLIILGFGLGAYGFLVPGALPGWLWKPLTVAGTLGALAAALNAARQIFFGGKTLGELWRETAPGSRPSAPCQAPRPVAEFVGRTGEIRRLERALKPGARAAITGVVGMGGIGKTELAKIVAHRVAGRYHDGVLWADCGDERLTDVADRWATAYGVERLPGDDLSAKAASWRGLISDKEALLVFDNVQPDQEVEPLFPAKGPALFSSPLAMPTILPCGALIPCGWISSPPPRPWPWRSGCWAGRPPALSGPRPATSSSW